MLLVCWKSKLIFENNQTLKLEIFYIYLLIYKFVDASIVDTYYMLLRRLFCQNRPGVAEPFRNTKLR